MEVKSRVECHGKIDVGMLVHKPGAGPLSDPIGEITNIEYVGNYVYDITAELYDDVIMLFYQNMHSVSLFVNNPVVLVDEYLDELDQMEIID
jgi:hypothetical protein